MKQLSWFSLPLVLVAAVVPAALHAQTITFAPPKPISVGAFNGQIANNPVAGDFNGDGNTDYLVHIYDQSTGNNYQYYKVLLGDGTGGFSIVNFTNEPAFIDAYLVADANGDGKDDIITLHGECVPTNGCSAHASSGAFTVFLSDGNGHFTAGYTSALPEGYAQGIVGDFNNDGKPDVAVLVTPNLAETDAQETLVIFLNQGNGSFLPTQYVILPGQQGNFFTLATGDFNGDGNLDLAVLVETNPDSQIYTFAGNGKGSLAEPRLSYTFGYYAASMVAANLNGGLKTDLVVSLFGTNRALFAILFPKSTGGFYWAGAVTNTLPDGAELPFSLSDLNGNGMDDLLVAGYSMNSNGNNEPLLGVFPGLGSGKFGSPSSFTLSPPYFLNESVAPLKRGELPSLMISDDLPTLELLVNTTKKP